jgi:outer membrane immunogenic protein
VCPAPLAQPITLRMGIGFGADAASRSELESSAPRLQATLLLADHRPVSISAVWLQFRLLWREGPMKRSAWLLASATASALVFAPMVASADGYRRASSKDELCCATWTGFYAGLNVGWARGTADIDSKGENNGFFSPSFFVGIVNSGVGDVSDSSVTAGGQLGYNYQQRNVLIGVEADLNSLRLDASRSYAGVDPNFPGSPWTGTDAARTNWLATLRGRAGLLISPALLLYGTAGVAFTKLDHTHEVVVAAASSATHRASGDDFKIGLVGGFGAEFALSGNWRLKAEYLYTRFGGSDDARHTVTPVGPFTASFTHSAEDLTIQTVRLGLNYGF